MASAATDLHTTAARRLAASGQRYTSSRRAIIEVLVSTQAPMTLPDILSADTTLAQSSAYRNLSELIAADVVHRIVTTDEHAHFELAEDLTEHHHHLICSSCGSVTDFQVPAAVETELDQALGQIAEREHFAVDHHRLDLVGRCHTCA
jgi:Fe2+ or Zn2+ uptake regulation protein